MVAEDPHLILTQSVLDLVGNTPLVSFRRIAGEHAVFAKAEWTSPGGSVKDRAAKAMILHGISTGRLTRQKTLIDATSGNTGIAYATLCAALGYRVALVMPANASPERKQTLKAMGVELVLSDAGEGTDGAQRVVKRIVAEHPGKYFYPDQYNNEWNWRAHYETTAEEIWRQTDGRITHFVAALGTSGTFVGTVRRLRELNPALRAIAVQPDSPLHGLEGVKHMATAVVPGIWDPSLADEIYEADSDDAHAMVLRLAREEGLMVGPSSGANVSAAIRVAAAAGEGAVVVTVMCDSAARYLSAPFWTEGETS